MDNYRIRGIMIYNRITHLCQQHSMDWDHHRAYMTINSLRTLAALAGVRVELQMYVGQ